MRLLGQLYNRIYDSRCRQKGGRLIVVTAIQVSKDVAM